MRKNPVFVVLLLLSVFCLKAQEKTLNEITSFKIRNSGAFIDGNYDVDGYYFFYEVDKLKKGQREFALKILDNNLNEIATKSYVDNKHTRLIQSKFNNQALMFGMVNEKEREYTLVSFDNQGNQQKPIKIPFTNKEYKWMENMLKFGQYNFLYSIDNKGFIFNQIKDNKKLGYSLRYIPTDGGEAWTYDSPAESKDILMINPIQANEKVVIAAETSKPSLLSQKFEYRILVLDASTGKLLFTKEHNNEDPRLISNALITKEDQIILMGQYFASGDNIYKDKEKGLFANITNFSGEVISDHKLSWEKDMDELLPVASNGKERRNSYVYFHNMVRTQDGSYYFIGEIFRKTASAGGIAMAALGGGGSVTQLTITDAVIFKFDKEFNLKDIKLIEKGKSRAPSMSDFGSPLLNAHMLNALGAFDYEFTQIDTDRDRFYVAFIDYERLDGEKDKFAYKSVNYKDGEITEDKVYLDNPDKKISVRVLPGKLGYVMLLEYNKKEKSIKTHLEKINF